ncbi:MAG: tryptophan halogenase [Gammaproteobacteria bacterium]|nr:MAG: tryptophan halogenase [Gammaproteobacteria bacterium]
MKQNSTINNVVIVGGGSAGWMTAAALSKHLPKSINIKLVESDLISTVGVGEATIPAIRIFNQGLGIDEAEFMKETNATFKLAIKFENWARQGDSYFHAFGFYGYPVNGVPFHNYWLKQNNTIKSDSIHDYNLAHQACVANKFAYRQFNPNDEDSRYFYAFQFDATLYAQYLRKISEGRGVERIEGKVVDVLQNTQSGTIESLVLESKKTVSGDLFIDCTGFRALLIDKTLKVGYKDWSHWLPVNNAWAVSTDYPKGATIPPYTRARALSAGWQWRIPQQNRTGDGNVFCDAYISKEEALDEFLSNLEGKPISDPRLIKFRTGMREKLWSKNCVSIGLSSGFLEPLESTSIYLIQASILQLIQNFPNGEENKSNQNEFNSLMKSRYEEARNFLILHYKATEREDTKFWKYCKNMSIPDELAYRIKLFEDRGFVAGKKLDLFSEHSWLAVYFGQRIMPKAYDPRTDNLSMEQINNNLSKIKMGINNSLDKMPTHNETLKAFCPADIATPLKNS